MNADSKNHDLVYFGLLREVLDHGVEKTDRTGTGTISRFGTQARFNLRSGLPLLTTKKLPFRTILGELLWFIQGDTRLRTLLNLGIHIWDDWPYKNYLKANQLSIPKPGSDDWESGIRIFCDKIIKDDTFNATWGDLGPVYGKQWRRWRTHKNSTIDQLRIAVETIRKNPDSRRIIVTAWNPADTDEMAVAGLPPCHCLFQFFVVNGRLSCSLYQRSCDLFLGVPFNIASYSLLTMMTASVTGLEPDEFIWTGGDTHIYLNHLDQVRLQMSREPRDVPIVTINPDVKELWDFTTDDIALSGYNPHPKIPAPIAV